MVNPNLDKDQMKRSSHVLPKFKPDWVLNFEKDLRKKKSGVVASAAFNQCSFELFD